MEEELPTRDRILLWTTLMTVLLAIVTTPPSFNFLSVGRSVFVAGSDIGPKVLNIMVGH
jgi:hypothetical protein